jgi:hypothetical protein
MLDDRFRVPVDWAIAVRGDVGHCRKRRPCIAPQLENFQLLAVFRSGTVRTVSVQTEIIRPLILLERSRKDPNVFLLIDRAAAVDRRR